MQPNNTEIFKTSNSKPTWKRIYIAAILFSCIYSVWADVRPFVKGTRFIGHADQAEVASVGRNILEGNGAVTDCVWLLHAGGRPTNEVRQPIGYWSLYMAGTLAICFKLLGATRISVLLVASLAKLCCAYLSGILILRVTQNYLASFTCFLLVVFMQIMLERVNGYSDMLLCAAVFCSIYFLVFGVLNRSLWQLLFAGIAGGLAIGFKPTGLIVIGLYAWMLLLVLAEKHGTRKQTCSIAAAMFGGCLLALIPLLVHNHKAGGSFSLPDATVVASANATRDADPNGNHDRAFYTPDTKLFSPTATTRLKLALKRLGRNAQGFMQDLSKGNYVSFFALAMVSCCTALPALKQTLRCRRLPTQPIELLSFIWGLLMIASLCLACVIHYEIRYWVFLAPVAVTISIATLFRYRPGSIYFILILGMLLALQAGRDSQWIVWSQEWDAPKMTCYKETSKYIPDTSIVMTPDPWEFAFHTRLSSVVLPVTENEQTIKSVAKRYDATYLVLVNGNHRHSYYNRFVSGNFPEFATPVHVSDNLIITKIDFDK